MVKREKVDFSETTWMSLLGLLHPNDLCVSVDQTTLWRKHLCWSKTSGQEIREYITQRYSSNMVFLSLLLGAELGIFFNSARFCTEMRTALERESYSVLKYYIGCVLLFGSCITLIGLITTFTSWGIISAISVSNAQTILRSSMGQYVTAMPARFVVVSLYLFLVGLLMILFDIMSGPIRIVLLITILGIFFQVTVSLSCFARLIIHTGAMGQKPVLDPEYERNLLPSGLHASLLILATDRTRRRTSVVTQYKTRSMGSSEKQAIEILSQDDDTSTQSEGITGEEEDALMTSASAFDESSIGPLRTASPRHSLEEEPDPPTLGEVPLPRPSVLNNTGIRELRNVVEMTLSNRSHITDTKHLDESKNQIKQRRKGRRQKSLLVKETSRRMKEEWMEESSVRDLYDIEPPAPLYKETKVDSVLKKPQSSYLEKFTSLLGKSEKKNSRKGDLESLLETSGTDFDRQSGSLLGITKSSNSSYESIEGLSSSTSSIQKKGKNAFKSLFGSGRSKRREKMTDG